MNPFKSAFVDVFIRERSEAARLAGGDGVADHGSEANGPQSRDQLGQEQLVWVLWKILKGDGADVSTNKRKKACCILTPCMLQLGPYSPATLATSPLPPKLRASQLMIDDTLTVTTTDDEPRDQ